jgi:hypothetical protein
MPEFRVCFGCVADGPKYRQQVYLLLATLRALGGDYANADFFLCVVGAITPEIKRATEGLSARIVSTDAYSQRHPYSNKLRFLGLSEIQGYDYAVLLDCDTAIAGSLERLFGGRGVRAKIADGATVPQQLLVELFSAAGLTSPEASYFTSLSNDRTLPYCNSGVVVIPGASAGMFAESWIRNNDWLLQHPELLPGCGTFCDQASLSLALTESRVAFEPLDVGLNFPTHWAPQFYTPDIARVAPAILHYHDRVSADGRVLRCPAVMANQAIARINDVWRQARPAS